MTSNVALNLNHPERWQPIFIEALRQTGHVGNSCEAANVSRATVYNHRRDDQAFASQWDQAISDAAWTLEDEATRRARDGVDEPIFYRDTLIGSQKKYSDTLLMFLLKGNRPEKFSDKLTIRLDPRQAAILKEHGLTAGEALEMLLQELVNEPADADTNEE